MSHKFYPQRIAMYLLGLFFMTLGIALSCKAGLGTTPISSVPFVISMFTPWTIGELTIIMNLLFIVIQPVLLHFIPWRQLLGQAATLVIFGPEIDMWMNLLVWFTPQSTLEMWLACLLSSVILALGVFFCVKARIFTAAGEGIVIVVDYVTHRGFAFLKNCFDITLVLIALTISLAAFGQLQGLGAGTLLSAVLVGRCVRLYERRLTFVRRWTVTEG